MSDSLVAARQIARAALAAALIESKTVDISSTFFDNKATGQAPSQSVEKLNIAVDMLMEHVVYR